VLRSREAPPLAFWLVGSCLKGIRGKLIVLLCSAVVLEQQVSICNRRRLPVFKVAKNVFVKYVICRWKYAFLLFPVTKNTDEITE
jgi:hypothetical protein